MNLGHTNNYTTGSVTLCLPALNSRLNHRLHAVQATVLVEPPKTLSVKVKRNREHDWEHGNRKLNHVNGDEAVRGSESDIEDPVGECKTELDCYH